MKNNDMSTLLGAGSRLFLGEATSNAVKSSLDLVGGVFGDEDAEEEQRRRSSRRIRTATMSRILCESLN